MMKKGKGAIICILLFVMLQMTKVILLHHFEATYDQGRLEFYPKEATNYESIALTYERDGKNRAQESMKCYIGEQYEQIGEKKEVEVRVLGVSHTYPDFERITLIQGNFWGEQAQREGRNVVVVSKALAGKLFNTYEVLGKTIKLNEKDYQVIGVYESQKDILATLVDCQEEEIYIPITSSLGQKMSVGSIWFTNEETAQQLNLGLGFTYERTDATKRLEGLKDLGINLLIWTVMVYLVKESIDITFFARGLDQKKKVGQVALCLISIFILGKCIVRHVYVPSESLPPYNIFDFSYYWDYFKEQIAMHQKMGRLSLTSFEVVYWIVSKWSIELTVVQFVLCFPIAQVIRKRLIYICHYK